MNFQIMNSKKYFFLLLFYPTICSASAISQLKYFIENTLSVSGKFKQSVIFDEDTNSKKISFSSGKFIFERPGKFRWEYEKPQSQILISDGKKIYIYDKDLNQLNIKDISKNLEYTPVSILFGNKNVEKNFRIYDLNKNQNIDWLEAYPKQQESSFEKILIGFKNNQLSSMKLFDNFGQVTTLIFFDIKKNLKFNKTEFNFEIPKDTDIYR